MMELGWYFAVVFLIAACAAIRFGKDRENQFEIFFLGSVLWPMFLLFGFFLGALWLVCFLRDLNNLYNKIKRRVESWE